MKVYVAGSYQFRQDIDRLVDKIQQTIPDFESTATWLRQGEEDDLLKEKGHDFFINLDRNDICRADVFLLINTYPLSKHSTGKWVELGIALELGLQIVIWGTLQDSLFVHGKNTINVHSPVEEDLIIALGIINKILRKEKEDLYDAHRSVGRTEARTTRIGTAPGIPEIGGEGVGAGVRDGEGFALHDPDRASENRVEGFGRPEARTARKYSEVGTPISQIEP
jgi:hypothetical protein